MAENLQQTVKIRWSRPEIRPEQGKFLLLKLPGCGDRVYWGIYKGETGNGYGMWQYCHEGLEKWQYRIGNQIGGRPAGGVRMWAYFSDLSEEENDLPGGESVRA